MAEFIAKLGLDAKDFISSMETAAAKAGSITTALNSSAGSSKTLADGFKSANTEAGNLDKNVKSIEGNLSKAASGGGALDGLTAKFKEGQKAASEGGGMFGSLATKIGELASPAGAATAAVAALGGALTAAYTIGSEFQQNLAGVSAVTGLSGAALDDIGDRARNLAKQFGGDASTQLQAFQGVLSKFGASLADTPEQLGKVSENINILAKAGGLDAKEAMDTLANSMLQFGVDVADGNVAAAESARYMNVLAASAKVGAAEIPQVGQAVLVAGVAAKGAKVSFEETNAAIQVLAAGGKVGAEAGTALRNVLGKIAGEEVLPKEAADKLKSLGVDMSIVSNRSLSLSDRLKELQKASSDATAFAQVFGSENAAAATILADGAGTIKDWTAQITGTSEANKQAATNMDTLSERVSRAKASISDFAIGLFQTLEPAFSAIIGGIMDFVGVVTDGIGGLWSFVEPLVMPIFEFFNLRLVVAFNVIKSVITGFVEAGREAFARFQEIIAPLQEKFQELFASAEGGTSIIDNLNGVFQVITDVVKNYFLVAFGLVLKVVEGLVFVIGKLIDGITTAVKWVKDVAKAVTDWGTNLVKTNEFIQAIVNNITAFVAKAVELKDQLLSLLGLGGQAQDVKIKAKVETKAEETKTAVETEAAKNPPVVKTKVKKADTKDISEEIRKQQDEIDKATREAQEASITDENARAIRNLENQYADKIAAIKAGNLKIQEDDKVTAAQKEQYAKITASRITAVEEELAQKVLQLKQKQADKQAEIDAKLAEKEATEKKKAEEKAIKDAEELLRKTEEQRKRSVAIKIDAIDSESGRELAKQIVDLDEKRKAILRSTDGTEAERLKIAERYAKQIKELQTGVTDDIAKQREKLRIEEQDLLVSLKKKKISYEDYSKEILRIQGDKTALEKQVDDNKKAVEEIKEIIEPVKEPIVVPLEVNAKGLDDLKKQTADLVTQALKDGKSYEQIWKDVLENINKNAQASFGAIGKAASSNVDFRKNGIIDNLTEFSTIFGSALLSAEAAGNNLKGSIQSSFSAVNDTISGSLIGLSEKSDAAFTKLLAQSQSKLSAVASLGGDAVDQVGAFVSNVGKSIQIVGEEAAYQLGAMVAQGKDATGSLLAVVGDSILKLITAYAPTIIASFLSFLGPFALPAATVAVAAITTLARGAISSLTAGFQDGGYTGNAGEGAVAGVVHGQEFVHTASVTRKNRALFEYLHKGGELSNWAVSAAGNLQQPVSIAAPMVNTYGIESRLDRLETAIVKSSKRFDSMRAVQMTVEHDPTLTIKAQSRNLQVRNARV